MAQDNRAAGTLPEDKWLPARLIPTSGIKGVDEQEKRATSALLSVMMAVPEFSRALLRRLGAPAGTPKAYLEPPFETQKGKMRPDGALVVRRGNHVWRAFVEVKTNTNELSREQIEGYLDIAKEHGFDTVVTISNQMGTAVDSHPLTVDKRKTKKVALHHFSWVEILSEAVMQREVRGVKDPDQAWILGELIAYLEHPQSGAMQFHDMGPHWVMIREAARDGSLRAGQPGVDEVILRWDQFMQFLCLDLGRDLRTKVSHVVPRLERDPAARRNYLLKRLTESGILDGTLRVENAVGDITLTTDLRARTVTASVAVEAPQDGRPLTRVNWLTRQLAGARDDIRVDAAFPGVRGSTSARLGDLREDAKRLLTADSSRNPRSFVVSLTREMGTKRGGASGSFVSEAMRLLLDFYRGVVEAIRPWRAQVPKLPVRPDTEDIATQPENVVEQVTRQQMPDE